MAKRYDLEDRTLQFARDTFSFVERLPRTITNYEIAKQLVRSAGSVGANYREANEALSKKDFLMRLRIARKEAKESIYWLELARCGEKDSAECQRLADESTQLMKILGSIIVRFEGRRPRKLQS